jgi:hypothetical protein
VHFPALHLPGWGGAHGGLSTWHPSLAKLAQGPALTLAIAAFTAATPAWFTTRVHASKHKAAKVTTVQSASVEHVRFPSTALCTEASACALAAPHETLLLDPPHAWTNRARAETAKTHLISTF